MKAWSSRPFTLSRGWTRWNMLTQAWSSRRCYPRRAFNQELTDGSLENEPAGTCPWARTLSILSFSSWSWVLVNGVYVPNLPNHVLVHLAPHEKEYGSGILLVNEHASNNVPSDLAWKPILVWTISHVDACLFGTSGMIGNARSRWLVPDCLSHAWDPRPPIDVSCELELMLTSERSLLSTRRCPARL